MPEFEVMSLHQENGFLRQLNSLSSSFREFCRLNRQMETRSQIVEE